MTKEKIDKRVIKTKEEIYDGLLKMLEKKAFEEIKVSEICNVAKINRTTFYSHFKDKYDLFDTFLKDIQNKLSEEIKQKDDIHDVKSYYMEVIKIILNHIEEEREVYKTIMIHNRYSIVLDMIQNTAISEITEHMKNSAEGQTAEIPFEFTASFYLGAVANISVDWILNQTKYSSEKIYKYIDLLIPNELK